MFTPKRALLVVFVIVAIGLNLTGAAIYGDNIYGFNSNGQIRPHGVRNSYSPLPNAFRQHQQTGSYSSSGSGYSQAPPPSANNQSSNQLRSLILSAVIIIIIILSRILACFENKNCQRAAAILNYLSTGVLVVMLYFIYNDIILSVH
eukprot:696151_1